MLRPVVTIDASMTVQDAREALKVYPNSTDIVLQRRVGPQLYWYAKRVGDIKQLPAGCDYLSLAEAFGLHEYQGSQSYQAELFSRDRLEDLSGVLLDGEQVIGILEPRPRLAAVSRSRASDTAPPPARPSAPHSGLPSAPRFKLPSFRRRGLKNGGEKAAPEIQAITAYPRVDAPDSVTPGEQFDLTIGLSPKQRAGVAGGPMKITTDEEEFDLVVQVIAQGFRAPEGIRRFLHVQRSRFQEAETKVRLIAPPVQNLLVTALEVEYSYQGNLLGRAWREIRVMPQGTSAPAEEVKTGATPIGSPSAETAPDLTVTINESPDGSTLVWTFISPHPVQLPSHQAETKFKQHNAQTFAIENIKSVAEFDGTGVIDNKVLGIARAIARQAPFEFWDVLGKVWTHVKGARSGQVPSVFLVSSEPYVPWELASTETDWVDQSLVDPARPLFLGAQLKVGRWLPEGPTTRRGFGRPRLPPETNVSIKKMAIVVGDYLATRGQRPLPKAIEEGKTLKKRYPAVWVDGTLHEVNRLLDNQLKENGEPVSVQAIHFACHGEVDPDNPRYNGIILSDTNIRLGEDIIGGNKMTQTSEPFVFVNACQLGLSSEILADYGGLAGAFLKEGCRGFIAPLWSVNDDVANELALEFYERALDENLEVSEVMRELRSKFDMKAESPPATYLAYVFYGHPKLLLSKAG